VISEAPPYFGEDSENYKYDVLYLIPPLTAPEAIPDISEKYTHMEDGTYFEGRVTAWDPPRLLRYTWCEETGEVSEVTYELMPATDNKVLLRLTHRKLGDDPAVLISVASGWQRHQNDRHLKGWLKGRSRKTGGYGNDRGLHGDLGSP